MNRSKAFVLVVLIALLAACQSPPRPASSQGAEDATTRAARALNAGRYIEAIELYREALAESPEKVGLHYGLGVASSHLDRRDDAVREFRWVVQYGPPKASEVEAARQWLIRAGALPPVLARSRAFADAQTPNAIVAENRQTDPNTWSRGFQTTPNGVIAAFPTQTSVNVGQPVTVLAVQFSGPATLATTIAPLQGTDGLWRADLLNAARFPAGEASGSGFFTFDYPHPSQDIGPLVVDRPVVEGSDRPDMNSGSPYRGDFGPFTGAFPYPETYFAPYTSAAAGRSADMRSSRPRKN